LFVRGRLYNPGSCLCFYKGGVIIVMSSLGDKDFVNFQIFLNNIHLFTVNRAYKVRDAENG